MRIAILACVLALALPSSLASAECEGVGVNCALNELGENRYEYVFTLINNSTDPIAIFFWKLGTPNIPNEWRTIEFEVPEGWYGQHPDKSLHFKTENNADLNPYRLFSESVLHCGFGTEFEFVWTFEDMGGPPPHCGFDPFDFTIHYQPIDPVTCLNAGTTLICPGPVPFVPATWGLVKNRYRD